MRPFLVLALLMSAVFARAQEPRLWMVFLVKGSATRPGATELQRMQEEHINNFKRLFGLHKLLMAGPLADPTTVRRGIVVLWVPDEAAVKECFLPDRYVQSGIMNLEIHPWNADKEGINYKDPDMVEIEENRLAILKANREIPDYLLKQHDRYIASHMSASVGGPYQEERYQACFLFHGKDETKLRSMLQAAPLVQMGWMSLEVIPQWSGKRSLRDR